MATTAGLGVRTTGARPRPRYTPVVAVRARMRGPWLDRELAAGTPSWASPVHSARALQITAPRARRELAIKLQAVLRRALAAPAEPGSLTTVVELDRRAVLAARPLLKTLVERLRDGEPLDARGVATLRELICDGSGPLYNPLSGDTLFRALAEISASLDVPD